MKKYLVITTLLIVSVFATGCIKSGPKEPSSKLKTYTNEKLGIEFQYPSNWNLYDYDEGNTNLSGITVTPFKEKDMMDEPGISGLRIYTFIKNPKVAKEFADGYIGRLKENKPFGDVELTEDTILLNNSIEAIRLRIKNIKLGSGDISNKETVIGETVGLWFNHNKVFFDVEYRYPLSDRDKYSKALEEIVSSIKFN